MATKYVSINFLHITALLILGFLATSAECGFYKWMSEAMGWNDGWESKGVTFGLKSKGMTAIIPFPLPIPIFTKDKKKEDSSSGGGGGGDSGGGGAKGSGGGGWEAAGGSDWWK